MRCLRYDGAGGPEVIRLAEAPDPVPGPGQVLVRVAAAGLNRADVIQRRGGYPAPAGWPPDIPGLEYAGTVEAVGPGVIRWRVGDAVMGLVGGGAHAELVAVGQDEALPVPAGMDLARAAAVPEAFMTAYDALVTRARTRSGERVLVHAVGSGVGTAAVQLTRWLGAVAVGTSRTADKLERARALGLAEAVLTAEGFSTVPGGPVHVILDVLGGPAFAANLAALAPRGRLVLLGTLQGAEAAGVDLARILRGRLEVIGTVMRSRGAGEREALAREFAARVVPLFAPEGDGPGLAPVIGAEFPMADLARAHRAMERGEVFGKIVLRW
jgi:NADPH:quinone reductase